jgi:WD40 repeat protein
VWAISLDSREELLAAGCEDGYVRLFDISHGALDYSRSLPGTSGVCCTPVRGRAVPVSSAALLLMVVLACRPSAGRGVASLGRSAVRSNSSRCVVERCGSDPVVRECNRRLVCSCSPGLVTGWDLSVVPARPSVRITVAGLGGTKATPVWSLAVLPYVPVAQLHRAVRAPSRPIPSHPLPSRQVSPVSCPCPGCLVARVSSRPRSAWCCSDFTVISGNSLGHVQFWDGKMGTGLHAFSDHRADVMSISVCYDVAARRSGERSSQRAPAAIVTCSVDGKVLTYTPVVDPTTESVRAGSACVTVTVPQLTIVCRRTAVCQTKWILGGWHRGHSHDVKSVSVSAEGVIASGGVDTELCLIRLQDITTLRPVKVRWCARVLRRCQWLWVDSARAVDRCCRLAPRP